MQKTPDNIIGGVGHLNKCDTCEVLGKRLTELELEKLNMGRHGVVYLKQGDKKTEDPHLTRVDRNHIIQEMLHLAQMYEAKTFVETGSRLAETTLFMAATGYFDRIHTVEIADDIHDWIRTWVPVTSVEKNISMDRIIFWHGDTVHCLPQIMTLTENRCIFWLDAHDTGEGYELSEHGNCVLAHELKAISEHSVKDHVIAISNILPCHMGLSDYPPVEHIIRTIEAINPRYCITIKYGVLWAEVPASAPGCVTSDIMLASPGTPERLVPEELEKKEADLKFEFETAVARQKLVTINARKILDEDELTADDMKKEAAEAEAKWEDDMDDTLQSWADDGGPLAVEKVNIKNNNRL